MEKPHIYLGADHGGYELKKLLLAQLLAAGYFATDLGTGSEESCDYPDYAKVVAQRVASEPRTLGILICNTGIGMSIAANKIPGAYAARCVSVEDAELARAHNGANILCLGGKITTPVVAWEMVEAFLSAEKLPERHARRRAKIYALEAQICR